MTPPPDPSAAAGDIRFVTEHLTAEEVAAATAVLTAALQQQAQSADPRLEAPRASAWSRSMRLREPLPRSWRSFQG
ncbi:acyl-CoA carboxylase epsilon subunit [Gryllotalpicola ginsengisoli]|uniref:acyl-CoA carboxylase epsilon subunit n=1 Tax=Gryllotalpicola ginsengisoli TaxID=444608 RepID=UPI0003F774A0|nr:acyl-CoA carboxylase epsilon subunit [Gryllotalpicola ginsengisoli]